MKKTAVLLALISTTVFTHLFAQENRNFSELNLLDNNSFNSYVSFYTSDIKDVFMPEKSGKYPSTNLFDGFFKTCWVAGNSQNNQSSSLYIHVPGKIDSDKIILNIFAGYGKTKALFKANARPKKIKLSLFSGFHPDAYSSEVTRLYLIKLFRTDTLELADSFGVQSFHLNIDIEQYLKFQKMAEDEYKLLQYENNPQPHADLILKREILDSYPGTKYKDICISEIFFNDRFVTAYPDRFREIQNVYLENENTLWVDYKYRKKIVVYRDTASVFTMLDYPPKSNWAILHYVTNAESGQDFRTGEMYALVDLKNKKIVEKEFEKRTGQYPLFIEKSDDGRILLTTFDDSYKIELK